MKIRFVSLTLAALAISSVPSWAVTIVNDTFTDGDRTNGTDALDVAWYKNSSAQTLSVVSNQLQLSTTAASQGIVGTIPTGVTLAVGESIELSFTFRYLTTPGSSTNGFRFGLYNDIGQTMTADTSSRDAANSGFSSVGYYANVSTGTATIANAFYREFGGTDGILAGVDRSSAVGTTDTSMGLTNTDSHTGFMRITATATGVSLTGSIDNVTFASGIATAPNANYLTFNQIGFSNNTTSSTVALDNINLVYIPEPATALLGGFGAILLAARRRR